MIRLQVLYPDPYPLPLHLLFFLSTTLLGSLCSEGVALPLLMSALGHAQKALSPPRQASEYLLACLSVCFVFWPRCPCTHHTHSLLLCSHLLQSSLNTAGLWWTLFLHEREMDRPFPGELNELRQSKRHRLKPTPTPTSPNITHPIACMVKQPWGSSL